MHAGGARCESNVEAIIDDQWDAMARASGAQGAGEFVKFLPAKVFFA
jgi:hypothetical protein